MSLAPVPPAPASLPVALPDGTIHDALRKAVSWRNALVHRGRAEVTHDQMRATLTAVADLL